MDIVGERGYDQRGLAEALSQDQFDALRSASYTMSSEGPFDYDGLNRIRNLSEELGEGSETGGYPAVFQRSDPSKYGGMDAVVLDHCALRTVANKVTWYDPKDSNQRYDYDAALYAIEELLDLQEHGVDIPVYTPHDMEEKLAQDVGQAGAAVFMDELDEYTDELVIDQDISVPAEYRGTGKQRGEVEDYRILLSADREIGGNILVMTTDNDIPQLGTGLSSTDTLTDSTILGLPAPMVQDAAQARKDFENLDY